MDIIPSLRASADEAKRRLAARLSSQLCSLRESGSPGLLLFSGGSALGILDLLKEESFGPSLTMAPVDERCDPSWEESNFAAFTKTACFPRAETAATRFIDMRAKPGQGREELSLASEHAIRGWMTNHPGGVTIALLGMGPDGHTAGIFPMDDEKRFHELFEKDRLVIGHRGPEYALCPERVTATLSLLRRMDRIYVFFTGEEKRAIWARAVVGTEPLHKLPAGIFRTLPRVEIFTDLEYNGSVNT